MKLAAVLGILGALLGLLVLFLVLGEVLRAQELDRAQGAVVLLVVEEEDPAEEQDHAVREDRAEDAQHRRELHFLSVLMPTFSMPILRTSSRTATTCLKSASASLFRITLGSCDVALNVCSFIGSWAIVIFSLL